MVEQVGSLEIGQDLEFQRREWSVQRAAWLLGALLLIAGLLGVFGGGPLTHESAASGPLTVDYDRFVRKRASTELTVQIAPSAAQGGDVAVWLDRAYLDKVEVERVLPEPTEMESAGDAVIFHVAVPEGSGAPAVVTFHLQPDEPGMVHGQLGVGDGSTVDFDQFIYP